MWGLLRIVLLIANAAVFACFGYFVVAEADISEWYQYLVDFGLLTFLALNVVYLLLHKRSDWRIFRLIGHWLEAKESVLRRRARQDKGHCESFNAERIRCRTLM
jgi:hypothetical protein